MESAKPRRAIDLPSVVIAAILALIAAVMAWNASSMRLSSTYGLGPDAMVYVVATGLAILAAGNLYNALTGGIPPREDFDPRAVLLILGGLAAFIAIITLGAGFIIGITVLFAATAAAFGRQNLWVDVAIGLGLGVAIYLLFAKLLTLSLPMGPIEHLL